MRQYTSGSGNIDLPLLLIDDEADNASINTNPKKATAINSGIRGLLKVFPRSSYVGFTATPFANVFINPDTTTEMEGDDLFPRDFIYALDAPSNYVGAHRIFGDNADLKCVETIDDAEEYFPKGMSSNSVVDVVPDSMLEAMLCFFIINTIMDLRSGMPKHRSMLVNVSHFTDVQNQVRDVLDHEVRVVQSDIRNYASLSIDEALRNKSIKKLYTCYKKFYSALDISWSQVQSALVAAVLPIQVVAVNQKSGPASLDYSSYKEYGLRVVAVGGNSLARGLTLEGLCVSYFFRGTQMYDALLQMGRWFGYRTGYEDLFKIWMSDETFDFYSHISEATDELRGDVKRMQVSRLKPIDFGLKVRSHPESLMITAKNKMRDTDEIVETISITQESLESPRLLQDHTVLAGNYKSAQNFILEVMKNNTLVADGKKFPVWFGVSKELIVKFLRSFVNHPLSIKLQTASLADFIERSDDLKLENWDVALPRGGGDPFKFVGELIVNPRQRKITKNDSIRALLINGSKLRVGSATDEKIGLSDSEIERVEKKSRADTLKKSNNIPGKDYTAVRQKPLLLIHLIQPKTPGSDLGVVVPEGCNALVAIGLSFPQLNVANQRVAYRINLIELRNILSGDTSSVESEDEDDEDDE
ncbi:Z1 domain-containing protein [Pseudomonas syringae]|uniref:Z1 domain-containing protein n=1 Tax=Pseudomonas syringae TaxID=317 RepID=UPI001058DDEC|nr:Z1 domain-containing protein [Pseudomonas syringae]